MRYLWLLLLAGCTATGEKFYTIDGTDYHVLRITEWNKPGITALVEHRTNEVPKTTATAAGNGVVGAVVNAAGFVAGAAVLGASMPADSINNQTFIGPPLQPGHPAGPTTIGNDKNTHPFTHSK